MTATPPRRVPLEVAGARGFRYAELEPELERRLGPWLDARSVPEGEHVRAGSVFRWRDLAIKFFGPARTRRFKDALPGSPAIRSADLHRRLLPIPSPEPLVALDRRRGGRRTLSLLVYRWIEGEFLEALWERRDGAALGAFPAFLAAMHGRRVFHGDFHLHNMIWGDGRWVLLDLVALRHPLRNLVPRRLAVEHWAKVAVGLEHWCGAVAAELEPLFAAYAAQGGVLSLEHWPAVLHRWDRAREELQRRGAPRSPEEA